MLNSVYLEQENANLKQQLALQQSQLSQQQIRIRALEDILASFKRRAFGASSEKLAADQLSLFNEADGEHADLPETETAADTVHVPAHTRRATRRISIPATLPREEVIHDLPDAQKFCPHDHTSLQCIGAEEHEQLDIIPAQIKVLRHRRLKYACPCCQQYVVTATKPAQPIEKSFAAPGLLAYIATQKYVDALPLYRQVDIFHRIGVELDRTTLANWMVRCGQLIQPLINLLHETILEHRVLHLDETIVQVLNEPGKTAQSHSYMWILRAVLPHAAVLFHYEPTRRGDVAKQLLREFAGAIMVDGYEGYRAVCTQNRITRLGCWAHARRKFMEAKQAQPKNKTGKADQALAWIQQLYRIEQDIKTLTVDQKFTARAQQAQPILDKLKIWLETSLLHAPPKTAIGKALHYLHTQWPRLIRYLEHGEYPIDNNPAENAIRPFVIGRKNWLFSASQQGATASANLYSLIETAKANGLEPYVYLRKVFTELPNAKTLAEVEALLPWQINLNVKGAVG